MGQPSNYKNRPTRVLSLSDLLVTANPTNGLAGKSTLQALKDLVAPNGVEPITEYADYTALLANTDILSGYFALVTDASSEGYTGWALYQYKGGDRDELASYRLIISQDVYDRFLPLIINSETYIQINQALTALIIAAGLDVYEAGETGIFNAYYRGDNSNNSYFELWASQGGSQKLYFTLSVNNSTGAVQFKIEDNRTGAEKVGLLLRGFGETNESATDGDYSDLLPTSLLPKQAAVNLFVPKAAEQDTVISGSYNSFMEWFLEVRETATNNNTIVDLYADASGSYIFLRSQFGAAGNAVLDLNQSFINFYYENAAGTKNSTVILGEDELTFGGKQIIDTTYVANAGRATLVAGTVTVNTDQVTANSLIFLSIQSLGTVTSPKSIAVTARVAATSFTITSEDVTDTSVIAWEIKETI
jgi:hypothetical protein